MKAQSVVERNPIAIVSEQLEAIFRAEPATRKVAIEVQPYQGNTNQFIRHTWERAKEKVKTGFQTKNGLVLDWIELQLWGLGHQRTWKTEDIPAIIGLPRSTVFNALKKIRKIYRATFSIIQKHGQTTITRLAKGLISPPSPSAHPTFVYSFDSSSFSTFYHNPVNLLAPDQTNPYVTAKTKTVLPLKQIVPLSCPTFETAYPTSWMGCLTSWTKTPLKPRYSDSSRDSVDIYIDNNKDKYSFFLSFYIPRLGNTSVLGEIEKKEGKKEEISFNLGEGVSKGQGTILQRVGELTKVSESFERVGELTKVSESFERVSELTKALELPVGIVQMTDKKDVFKPEHDPTANMSKEEKEAWARAKITELQKQFGIGEIEEKKADRHKGTSYVPKDSYAEVGGSIATEEIEQMRTLTPAQTENNEIFNLDELPSQFLSHPRVCSLNPDQQRELFGYCWHRFQELPNAKSAANGWKAIRSPLHWILGCLDKFLYQDWNLTFNSPIFLPKDRTTTEAKSLELQEIAWLEKVEANPSKLAFYEEVNPARLAKARELRDNLEF